MLRVAGLMVCLMVGLGQSPAFADGEECPLEFATSRLCAAIEWTEGPLLQKESRFFLRFWRRSPSISEGGFVDPEGTLAVKLWMDMGGHGHGSSPTRIVRQEAGVYEVSKLYFVMKGAWQVRIQLKQGDSVLEEALSEVEIK